jgi:hypothetical protein
VTLAIETIRVLTRLRGVGLVEVHHIGNLAVITRRRQFVALAVMIGNEVMQPRTAEQQRKQRLWHRRAMNTYTKTPAARAKKRARRQRARQRRNQA